MGGGEAEGAGRMSMGRLSSNRHANQPKPVPMRIGLRLRNPDHRQNLPQSADFAVQHLDLWPL